MMFRILKKLFTKSNPTDLRQLIKDGALLVDVRSRQEYASGHVSGSLNIPLDTLPQQLDRFSSHEYKIVFCQSGMRSMQAKTILERYGISHVINGGTWEKINRLVNS